LLQDDVNGKIKGINNIIEVLNTMIPKDSLKEVKKVESKKSVIIYFIVYYFNIHINNFYLILDYRT